MAITMPGANVRLLPGKSRVLLQPRWITIHTMVGTLAGTESYFTPSGRPYSHFGLGGDGEIRQWQDLAYRAASDLEGNPYSISIECADHGPEFPRWSGSDVPAFTPAQVDTLIVALSWLCHRFGLPKQAITTSCPHERGIGYHRLGVDPWRNQSCGQRWSSARGKVCPGDRRIHQLLHEIIPRVSAPHGKEPDMSDALTRTSHIYILSDLLGFTAEQRKAFLDKGRDGVKIPTYESIVRKAVRAELGALRFPTAAEIAAEVVKALPAGSGGNLSVAEMQEAFRAVLVEQLSQARITLPGG